MVLLVVGDEVGGGLFKEGLGMWLFVDKNGLWY